jgi:hypothetical protein
MDVFVRSMDEETYSYCFYSFYYYLRNFPNSASILMKLILENEYSAMRRLMSELNNIDYFGAIIDPCSKCICILLETLEDP